MRNTEKNHKAHRWARNYECKKKQHSLEKKYWKKIKILEYQKIRYKIKQFLIEINHVCDVWPTTPLLDNYSNVIKTNIHRDTCMKIFMTWFIST